MRVLLTGMSGSGKSTLVAELRRRGVVAYDADEDGFSEVREHGRWGWRRAAVEELLASHTEGLLCFAGCSEEQAHLPFDYRVLLTVPEAVLIERLRSRTNNPYGQTDEERAQILSDRDEVEPLLRRTADLILESTASPAHLADAVLSSVGPSSPRAPGTRTPAADAASGGS
ncbi:AAA family ATPase [Solirubrobacter taibaiensis]|nr:AAA family ATPase [Solirubrobacter taibaiensis]